MCNSQPMTVANVSDSVNLCKNMFIKFSKNILSFKDAFFDDALQSLQDSINELVRENNELRADNQALRNQLIQDNKIANTKLDWELGFMRSDYAKMERSMNARLAEARQQTLEAREQRIEAEKQAEEALAQKIALESEGAASMTKVAEKLAEKKRAQEAQEAQSQTAAILSREEREDKIEKALRTRWTSNFKLNPRNGLRCDYFNHVIRMHFLEGLRYADITRKLNHKVCASTAGDWCNAFRTRFPEIASA